MRKRIAISIAELNMTAALTVFEGALDAERKAYRVKNLDNGDSQHD